MRPIINLQPATTHPITIYTSLAASGELQLTCNDALIPDEEPLLVKHLRLSDLDPVVVPVTLVAPDHHWRIEARHADSAWTTNGEPDKCSWTWAETDREYAITLTVYPSSEGAAEPKKKTVYLTVRPEPDLPDC
jgi:hypothetical protein